MKHKKHLNFGSLRHSLSSCFRTFPDNRQTAKIDYSIHDSLMSAFACMYFQDPSLLQFQKELRDQKNLDNLETIFAVQNVPGNTRIRNIIDNVDSEQFRSVFKEYFYRLQRNKQLKEFEFFHGLYLCSIDGTQYYHSTKIHCSSCLKTNKRNKIISYSHKILQAAIMHPDMRQVIPLMPEEISNVDGDTKQDCEINASKRLIPKLRKDHPQLGIIIVGDGLFSKQPFISDILSERMHYLLVAKPSDHTVMMEFIQMNQSALNEIWITDKKERIHHYEWINNIPLNGRKDAIQVNYVRYTIVSKTKNGNEKINYRNCWVTDFVITNKNVVTIVKGGRCRWKIENECFNTLKNQGYHLEHNFGHGSKNLCFNFLLLTLIAFFFHQIFELTDNLYQECREKFGSKRHMWESLRSYIKILIFNNWEHLLDFALTPTKYNAIFDPQ